MSKPIVFVVCLIGILITAPLALAEPLDIDTSSPFLSTDVSKTISMDFQEAALDNVLKIFSQQTNINFITAESVANKKVTVYLDKVPVDQALEQLLRANNLTYEVQAGSNIYIVKPLAQPEFELITRVYPLKNATVSKAQMQKTFTIEEDESSSSSGSSGSKGSSSSSGSDSKDEGNISQTIKTLLTSKGKLAEDIRTNSLVISDIASNFPKIENAIAKLDVPVPQILIEVEMLEVAKSTADLIGNKTSGTYSVLTGSKRLNLFPFALPQNYTWDEGPYFAGSVDFSGMQSTLQFLRTQTDSKTLARPRILTLNNQTAQIRISTDEVIGTQQTVSGSSSNIATSSTSAERYQTGVFLTVTPQANLLTGELIMAVAPRVVVTKPSASFGSSTFRDPEERGTKALLRIRDGDTVVIGGLMRQDVTKITTKVPLLGDIPFLGSLFRHHNDQVSEKELIVFLTPHIINENAEAQVNAPAIKRINREQDQPVALQAPMDQGLITIPQKNN